MTQYALFIYNPDQNITTFARIDSSKEALIAYAHKTFMDDLAFSIYKFNQNGFITTKQVPMTKWCLDTKFNGMKIDSHNMHRNQPMECAYMIDDGHEWLFKTF